MDIIKPALNSLVNEQTGEYYVDELRQLTKSNLDMSTLINEIKSAMSKSIKANPKQVCDHPEFVNLSNGRYSLGLNFFVEEDPSFISPCELSSQPTSLIRALNPVPPGYQSPQSGIVFRHYQEQMNLVQNDLIQLQAVGESPNFVHPAALNDYDDYWGSRRRDMTDEERSDFVSSQCSQGQMTALHQREPELQILAM